MCVCYFVCLGCFALCCLPVFTCKVTSAAGACPCLPLLDCIGCVPPASLAMRASVRQRYGIPVGPRNPQVPASLESRSFPIFPDLAFYFSTFTFSFVLEHLECGDDGFLTAFEMGAAQATHPHLRCRAICRPPM